MSKFIVASHNWYVSVFSSFFERTSFTIHVILPTAQFFVYCVVFVVHPETPKNIPLENPKVIQGLYYDLFYDHCHRCEPGCTLYPKTYSNTNNKSSNWVKSPSLKSGASFEIKCKAKYYN